MSVPRSGALWHAGLMTRLDAALLNSGITRPAEERTIGGLRATASYCRELAGMCEEGMGRGLLDVATKLEAEALSKGGSH